MKRARHTFECLTIACSMLAAASCRTKSDAPEQAAAPAASSAAPAPTDPDEMDPAGAPTAPAATATAAATGSAGAREPSAVPLPPTSMPDPAPPPTLRPDSGGYAALVAVFDGYGIPAHPRVDPLCARRVYQQGGRHLTWDAFASNDEPAALVAYYRSRLGDAGFSAEGDGGVWRLPAGAPTPQRTLTISRSGKSGPHDACEKKPGPGAKSVLRLSRDH